MHSRIIVLFAFVAVCLALPYDQPNYGQIKPAIYYPEKKTFTPLIYRPSQDKPKIILTRARREFDITTGAQGNNHGQGSAYVRGSVPVFRNDNHRLDAYAQHNRDFGTMRGRTSGGLNYEHSSGLGAYAGMSHTNGIPGNDKMFGASYTYRFG